MRLLLSRPTRFQSREWRDGMQFFSNCVLLRQPFFHWQTIPRFRARRASPEPIWQAPDQMTAATRNRPFVSRETRHSASSGQAASPWQWVRTPPVRGGAATNASFLRRRRQGCIEPSLKFATTGRESARQFMQFQTQHRHHFAIVEFVEIIESQNTALRVGRGGNPNRQLSGLELFDLFGCVWRDFARFVRSPLRLHAVRNDIEATPARFTKKPVAIWRRLTLGSQKRRFAHGILENILRFCCLASHEEAKAIELR